MVGVGENSDLFGPLVGSERSEVYMAQLGSADGQDWDGLMAQLESVAPHKRAGFIDSALAGGRIGSTKQFEALMKMLPDSKRGNEQFCSLSDRRDGMVKAEIDSQNEVKENIRGIMNLVRDDVSLMY